MKNLKRLFSISLLLITGMAFRDDDDTRSEDNQANIIGAWKLTSATCDGEVEEIDDCDLILLISSTQVTKSEHWGNNCKKIDTDSIGYTISDNNITVTEDGYSYVSEIITLNNTTLSIKDEDEGDVYIETYTRQ